MNWHDQAVYFLGAGATVADFPEAPLGKHLLHHILVREVLGSPLLGFLGYVFDPESLNPSRSPDQRPRIDDVFTVIETAINGKAPAPAGLSREDLISAKHLIVAAIGKTLDESLRTANSEIATCFAKVLRNCPRPVISTNYDIVMDNALFLQGNVNYGVRVRSAVVKMGAVLEGRKDEVRYFHYDHTKDHFLRQGEVPLYKLHGSLNWLYCPRCDELDITLLEKGGVHVLNSPDWGRCYRGECTGRYEAILVGPSLEQRYENRILRETWVRSEAALAKADRLVVIGYSMPEADYLIRSMLARQFAKRSDRILVVSREKESDDEKKRLEESYRRLFPHCQFRWDGFRGYVDSL